LILLSSAGNDTTKQTTSHTMLALANNPAQRDWLMEDFEGRITWAVEEFVRWSSPVLHFARFATEDTEIAGQEIKAGDKLGLFYCSANRDESVFAEPHTFNLQRSPNPHLDQERVLGDVQLRADAVGIVGDGEQPLHRRHGLAFDEIHRRLDPRFAGTVVERLGQPPPVETVQIVAVPLLFEIAVARFRQRPSGGAAACMTSLVSS
jgi:hypothetical protein